MTKSKTSIDRIARGAGILLGVTIAIALLIAWQVPGGERTLGADVRIEALQTGEIGVAPLHPFVASPSLLPGASLAGDVTMRNQTGVPLALRLRALPSVRDLDRLLLIRVSAGKRALYDGDLAGLRAGGTAPLVLKKASAERVHVSVALPPGLRTGFQGRILDVSLQIDTQHPR